MARTRSPIAGASPGVSSHVGMTVRVLQSIYGVGVLLLSLASALLLAVAGPSRYPAGASETVGVSVTLRVRGDRSAVSVVVLHASGDATILQRDWDDRLLKHPSRLASPQHTGVRTSRSSGGASRTAERGRSLDGRA